MASGDAEITLVGGELRLTAPYDADFIAELKRLIPYRERRWDADEKVWVIHKMFRRQVIDLCEEHYDHVDVDDATKRAVKNPPPKPAASTDAVVTTAYADIVRFTTDDALQIIYELALEDRKNDSQGQRVIREAFEIVHAHRDRTGRTG